MGIVWMVGTAESVRHDGYKDGPSPSKASLVQYMDEGDVLVGKHRDGTVASCERLVNGGFVPWPHPGLEAEMPLPSVGRF